METLEVPGSFELFKLQATGLTIYFCENSTLNLDGEAEASVASADGQWVGKHEYPLDGLSLGQPTWYLTNTVTGETRHIYGENKPQVKKPSPAGADIDWTRRIMYGDISSFDPPDNTTRGPPKTWYVVRTDTTSGGKPKSTVCDVDKDVTMPFTATYTFLSCDYYGRPPPVAPATAPLPAAAPLAAPVPAPVPAEAPVPAPVPAPAPQVLAPALAPAAAVPSPAAAFLPAPPRPVFAPPPSAASRSSLAAGAAAALLAVTALL
jgi:hypothetical protein